MTEQQFAAIMAKLEKIEHDRNSIDDAMCEMQNAMMAMLHKIDQQNEAAK